jgi:phosphoribosylformylglycinamidine synthase I
MSPRVAVLRFPGSNCEAESLRAILRVGIDGRIVRWNEPEEELERFQGYLLPGGFSYQDRIRAGAVAARLPVLDVLVRRAREGAPIVGLCNGAQILAEAGLVPRADDMVAVALAPNRMPGRSGYYTRWVYLAPGPAAGECLFTRALREPVPVPMAHAEGRFVTSPDAAGELAARSCLVYADPDGRLASGFPWNPNGSLASVAGLTNEAGNVLALMPHPERAQLLAQVPPGLPGGWGDLRRSSKGAEDLERDGPGIFLFRALARALEEVS